MQASETQSVTMRLQPELVEAMDARAKTVRMNRTEWVSAALSWVLTELPTEADADTRVQARAIMRGQL